MLHELKAYWPSRMSLITVYYMLCHVSDLNATFLQLYWFLQFNWFLSALYKPVKTGRCKNWKTNGDWKCFCSLQFSLKVGNCFAFSLCCLYTRHSNKTKNKLGPYNRNLINLTWSVFTALLSCTCSFSLLRRLVWPRA